MALHRDGPARRLEFTTRRAGEALLDLAAAAPDADWERPGHESAVVSIGVDGRYVSDLVIPLATPTPRRLALGRLDVGDHVLTARFAADRSPVGVCGARLDDLAVAVAAAGDPLHDALRHAPVLYGRTLPELGTPFQNAITDTPLLAWHETLPAAAGGHRVLEYSMVWSNEDDGTGTAALMARWGRSTDIEWIYRVEVDAAGDRVASSAVYQGPDHRTLAFRGRYEGDHPLLETRTANNNVCDRVTGPMRFALAADQTRPAGRARELLMDANPWTYRVMAKELVREGKVAPGASPLTPDVSDQRNYLYVEVVKDTAAPGGTGLAVGVRLRGDPTLYRSDHGVPSWSIERDLPAATTVELPAGTTADAVAEVVAIRQPIGQVDSGAAVTVRAVNRGFLLDDGYLPRASFLEWLGAVVLTRDRPQAPLIRR